MLPSGYRPAYSLQNEAPLPPDPIQCHFRAVTGIWLTWAVPEYFHEMAPNQLMLYWPDTDEVLSPEAMEVLATLDQPLRERFDQFWYGSRISPSDARFMACAAMKKDLDLRHIPFTSTPSIEDLISADSMETYRDLPEQRKRLIEGSIVTSAVMGRVSEPPHVPGKTYTPDDRREMTYAYGSTSEEFLEALQVYLKTSIELAAQQPEQ